MTSAGPRRVREREIIVARRTRRLFSVITAGMIAVALGLVPSAWPGAGWVTTAMPNFVAGRGHFRICSLAGGDRCRRACPAQHRCERLAPPPRAAPRPARNPGCSPSAPLTVSRGNSSPSRRRWTPLRPATGSSSRRGTTRSAATTPRTRRTGRRAAGVFIDKPDLHLLGLSRGGVVVDGTKSGPPCSASPADQDRGPAGPSGPWGRNGIEVYEASGVTIQNLTVCNFLSGQRGSGNQIWWNGGYGTSQVHMHSLLRLVPVGHHHVLSEKRPRTGDLRDLRLARQRARPDRPGLREQHERFRLLRRRLPGLQRRSWTTSTLRTARSASRPATPAATWSSVTASSTATASASLTNSESNGDLPAPQDGACPGGSGSCWVVTGNYFHDNNNRDVPGNGLGLVGVGFLVLGGRNDTPARRA